MDNKPAGKASSGPKTREQRLADQLRANLAKRKAQARGRQEEPQSNADDRAAAAKNTELP